VEGAVADVYKVGEAAVLELGAIEGLVHEGDLGVLEDRGVVENDGVIVGAPIAARPDAGEDHLGVILHRDSVIIGAPISARPDADGHVDVGKDLKRARGVPSLGECLVVGRYDALVDRGEVLLGEVVKSSMHNDLGLRSLSAVGGIDRLGRDRDGVSGSIASRTDGTFVTCIAGNK
jgi:hypothetical protein